jgi:glutamate 5-kinase
VDGGAARAVTGAGKSLLAAGVTGVGGVFTHGSAIEVRHDGVLIAKGLAALGSHEVERHLGQHTDVAGGEVIHRDDLVVLT